MALPNRKNKEGRGQDRLIAGMAILVLIGAVTVLMTMKNLPAGGDAPPVAVTPAPALTPITPDKSGSMPDGVIAPTPAQQNASQQVPVVDVVHMNPLALERLNAPTGRRGACRRWCCRPSLPGMKSIRPFILPPPPTRRMRRIRKILNGPN